MAQHNFTAKRLLSQGRAEGEARRRAEGEARGRAEGEATVLTRQLALKFGALDRSTTERLSRASTTELERWAEGVLTATSLEDVFG